MVTLLFTDSISVDNEVRRLTLLLILEDHDSLLNQLLHLLLYQLLTLGLDDIVREVLAESFISAGCESNYTVLTGMAHINTNEHSLKLGNDFRELHREEVTSDFTIHLSDDIRGLRMIEGIGIPASDDLRGHSVLLKGELVHWVVVLSA